MAEPVVIYESKTKLWKIAGFCILGLLLVVGLEWWLASGNRWSAKVTVMRWVLCVVTPLVILKALLPSKALLRLTPEAIVFTPLVGKRTFEWTEVSDFGIRITRAVGQEIPEFFVSSSKGQREIVIQEGLLPGTLEELEQVFKAYRDSIAQTGAKT
jgi:hypothetical protein